VLVRRRLVVRGLVQGVGFRYAVVERARGRGLSGWVRNLPDGSVEAVLEGEREAVDALVRFCESGPRGAEVDRVEVADEPVEGLAGFSVR
jgi:acylphosphatase